MTQATSPTSARLLEHSFANVMELLGLKEMKIRKDNQAAARWRWTVEWFSPKKGKVLHVKAETLQEAIDKAREVLES